LGTCQIARTLDFTAFFHPPFSQKQKAVLKSVPKSKVSPQKNLFPKNENMFPKNATESPKTRFSQKSFGFWEFTKSLNPLILKGFPDASPYPKNTFSLNLHVSRHPPLPSIHLKKGKLAFPPKNRLPKSKGFTHIWGKRGSDHSSKLP